MTTPTQAEREALIEKARYFDDQPHSPSEMRNMVDFHLSLSHHADARAEGQRHKAALDEIAKTNKDPCSSIAYAALAVEAVCPDCQGVGDSKYGGQDNKCESCRHPAALKAQPPAGEGESPRTLEDRYRVACATGDELGRRLREANADRDTLRAEVARVTQERDGCHAAGERIMAAVKPRRGELVAEAVERVVAERDEARASAKGVMGADGKPRAVVYTATSDETHEGHLLIDASGDRAGPNHGGGWVTSHGETILVLAPDAPPTHSLSPLAEAMKPAGDKTCDTSSASSSGTSGADAASGAAASPSKSSTATPAPTSSPSVSASAGAVANATDAQPPEAAKVLAAEMAPAIGLIAAERQRQIDKEGWTRGHDDTHRNGELAEAAGCYAMPEARRDYDRSISPHCRLAPCSWPWAREWWKPSPDDRVRELVKAGALIVAEIERLQLVRHPTCVIRQAEGEAAEGKAIHRLRNDVDYDGLKWHEQRIIDAILELASKLEAGGGRRG